MTTITPKNLAAATLTSSLTDIYTVPSATTTRLEHLIVSSITAGTVLVKYYKASASAAYNLLPNVAISANGILELADLVLQTGDKIQASAATTTDAVIILSGQEQS